MNSEALLQWAKDRTWFYEINLPDRSTTKTNIPAEVLEIHKTRERHLEKIISENVKDHKNLSALDIASHEGYFSLTLAKHFKTVLGIEQRFESIDSANKLIKLLKTNNIEFQHSTIEAVNPEKYAKDFVLMYGLLYHVQDPISMLVQVAALSKKYLCIETQVLPYDIVGDVEDGHYKWTRPVHGLFGLVEDYPDGREGGSKSFAMVPSKNGLTWILGKLGFSKVFIVKPEEVDYEQFKRSQRVIIFAER